MRRIGLLVVLSALAGCSTELSGLGPEGEPDASGDDTSVVSDEGTDDIQPLFDAEPEAALDAADSAIVETSSKADTAEDTFVATDTSIEETLLPDVAPETAEDVAPDTTPEPDALPDVGDSSPLDTGADADDASTGPLASVPGRVACHDSGANKLCASGQMCCGGLTWSLSWAWRCASGCGTGERDYRCDEKADCTSGVCCGTRNIGGTLNGSNCRTTCGEDPQLCTTHAECLGGKTCTLTKVPDAPHSVGTCK